MNFQPTNKVPGLQQAIVIVESRIRTSNALKYLDVYIEGQKDILIFLKAQLERELRGEGVSGTYLD